MQNVCAVVVTYNRLEMLKRCVGALINQTCTCDILVIDNASDDGTEEWLLSKKNVLSYLRMEKNTGGAGGFNAGMREAVLRGYKYIWIMDDDTIPKEDALEKLLEADRVLEGKYGWLCSVPLWTDGKECRINRPKLTTNTFDDIQFLGEGLLRVSQATFVGLFLKTATVKQVGLPIKEFFIWGDDIEYTRRIAVRGNIPCFIAGKSIVTHATKDNTGSNIAKDSVERLVRYNYAFRNENYLYRKEGVKGFLYYFAKCGKNIVCSLVFAKDYRFKRAGIVLKQFFSGLFFNPKVEYLEENNENS